MWGHHESYLPSSSAWVMAQTFISQGRGLKHSHAFGLLKNQEGGMITNKQELFHIQHILLITSLLSHPPGPTQSSDSASIMPHRFMAIFLFGTETFSGLSLMGYKYLCSWPLNFVLPQTWESYCSHILSFFSSFYFRHALPTPDTPTKHNLFN